MSKEEIRKLLGGYSSNTLTESERKALFEAALEDQEVFNALQQEQALKSLLDDPATRAQVRQALEQQPSGRQMAGTRMRWWAWGGAASAAVVAALLFVVFRPNPARLGEPPVQIARPGKAPSPLVPDEQFTVETTSPKEPPPRETQSTSTAVARNSLPSAPEAAPPPITPAPVQSQTGQSFRQQEAVGQVPNRVAPAVATGADAVGSLKAPLLRYFVLKGENGNFAPTPEAELKPGDQVHLQVSATLPGQLTLSRLDEAGEWQRIADVGVLANSGYTIPDSPIQVTATAQRYRLTLETSLPQAGTVGGIAGGPKRAMRAASAAQSAASAPAVVEITIGGKAGN